MRVFYFKKYNAKIQSQIEALGLTIIETKFCDGFIKIKAKVLKTKTDKLV